MVDASSSDKVPSRDVVALSVADQNKADGIYFGQVMCLIKLREKGGTKVSKLPSGVFRCILER